MAAGGVETAALLEQDTTISIPTRNERLDGNPLLHAGIRADFVLLKWGADFGSITIFLAFRMITTKQLF